MMPSLLSHHQKDYSYQKQRNETKQKPSAFREEINKLTNILKKWKMGKASATGHQPESWKHGKLIKIKGVNRKL